jgi:hypothetical protein
MEDKAYSAKLLVNHEFVHAGTLEELKSKGRLLVHGPHRPILVIEEQDRVYALDNRRPHMGFPLDRGSEWGNTEPGRHILIAVARYLAAHSPTERALLQTADIAARLSRGDRLHENA